MSPEVEAFWKKSIPGNGGMFELLSMPMSQFDEAVVKVLESIDRRLGALEGRAEIQATMEMEQNERGHPGL
jgi:hypothetical protein